MKTKRIFYTLLVLAVVCTFSSCKKYPEGPTISLRTPKRRLKGKWKIDKLTVDGSDETDSLDFIDYFQFYIKNGNEGHYFMNVEFKYKLQNGFVSLRGNYQLLPDSIVFSTSFTALQLFVKHIIIMDLYHKYKILELRHKHATFKENIDGTTYLLELKR